MRPGKEKVMLRLMGVLSRSGLDANQTNREWGRRFFAATLILLSIIISTISLSKVKAIEARSLLQGEIDPLSAYSVLFTDVFDRADNDVVGNGWAEVEETGAQVGILDNRLCFQDTSDIVNRPMVSNSFPLANSGELNWQFDFEWSQRGAEKNYRQFMQIGQGSLMSESSQNDGVGINLVWTLLDNVPETLAYRKDGSDTSLARVSGPAIIVVTANLDDNTYQVQVNGMIVGSAIPFDNLVDLDTLRFFTDGLNEVHFTGRCFDNVTIAAASSSMTVTPTETPTSTPTFTEFPTDTATPTSTLALPSNTPTITGTPEITFTLTPEPSATPTSTSGLPTATPTETLSPTPTPSPTSLPAATTFERKEIVLTGPSSTGMGEPNPFLIEVQVTFISPSGQTFTIPAFYDGDGNGGMDGNVWKIRFAPDTPGSWTYMTTSSNAMLNGQTGAFEAISPTDCQAYAPGGLPDFTCLGRLEYDGSHYLKFSNGEHWLKGGIDDPENFLGSAFGDWNAKQLAIDTLASKGVNSIYLVLNNISGDRNDTWPWVGNTTFEAITNSNRFDLAKLLLWESFFTYAQEKGIVLHLILDDDSAWAGYDHALYYREMVARFSHHPGIIWNIGEEANEIYTDEEQVTHANTIRSLDAYDHPVTVHRTPTWPFLGNPSFDLTSIQPIDGALDFSTADLGDLNAMVISHRNLSTSAGRPIPIMVDELPRVTVVDEAARLKMRKEVLYPIFLGGGSHEMHYFDSYGEGGTVSIEMLEPMLLDMKRVRQFTENLPYSQMIPCNQLLSPVGNLCSGKTGEIYALYLPGGGSTNMDLTGEGSAYSLAWFDPRMGVEVDGGLVESGAVRTLSAPDNQDWALVMRFQPPTPTPTATQTATPTEVPTPTETPTPTLTPSVTDTPTPTSKVTATSTPPPSSTPMETATSTPMPTDTPTATMTSTPTATVGPITLFSDGFNRVDGNVVGNEWVEVEATGAQVGLQANRMCYLDSSDVANRPLVRHSFPQVTSGSLVWEYDFDWTRTGSEGTYALLMQLGEGALLSDNAQDTGVGVNLIWTVVGGTHQTLGYRKDGVTMGMRTLSGPAHLTVEVNLDTGTYSVAVDGVQVVGEIPFEDGVALDTVRFFTSGLNEVNFSGRCFDNVSLRLGGSAGTAPVFSSVPVTTGLLWQAYSYAVNASGDPAPTYTLTNAPLGMLIDPVSGLISWTPPAAGTYNVTVQANNSAGSTSQNYAISVNAEPQFTCTTSVRIMPLGDSITVGKSSGVDDVTRQISYRKDLWDSLLAANYSINFVGSLINGEFYTDFDPDHEGHSGWRDDQIALNIYDNGGANWLSNTPPDVILLHIGTNAINSSPTDVENILDEINQYETANNTTVIVILARIINMVPNNATVTQFNDNVFAMAQSRINDGDKIILVNMESGAGLIYNIQPAGDMWDSLHPFASGYTKMADVWYNALNGILPDCP